MMAPIFKQVAADYVDKAVFVKVDTNAQHELSSRYQIRSLPTFQYFVNGKKVDQALGGIGEQGLRQQTDKTVRTAELENVVMTIESLKDYYKQVEPAKTETEIETVYKKCVDANKKAAKCVGSTANQLARRLKQKYKQSLLLDVRFTKDNRTSTTDNRNSNPRGGPAKGTSKAGGSLQPNLGLATKEELQQELLRRLDEERDAQVEQEDDQDDEPDPDFTPWAASGFPERMIVIGGGPAGLSAAVYGARAGLKPLVIAPSMGGQLQGKGVDVENYPGMHNMTGPALVANMRRQAAHFGAVFEDDTVVKIDATSRPIKVYTNTSGAIAAHTVVLATGAEANWLGVKGEWELRGGGVSSCATCDGFLYSEKM
jgi:thiol-disulfide isomerase/thioredoxin